VRQVGQRHQQRRALLLGLVDLDLELADMLRPGLAGGKQRRRVDALALGARDLVTGGVLLALQAFHFRDQPSAPGFERRQLLEVGVGIHAAVAVGRAHVFKTIAHGGGVDHETDPNGKKTTDGGKTRVLLALGRRRRRRRRRRGWS
jgi:hypothetical protein